MTFPLPGGGRMHHRNQDQVMATGYTRSRVCLKSWKHLVFPSRNRNQNLRNEGANPSPRVQRPSSLRGRAVAQGRIQINLSGFYSPTDWETFSSNDNMTKPRIVQSLLSYYSILSLHLLSVPLRCYPTLLPKQLVEIAGLLNPQEWKISASESL